MAEDRVAVSLPELQTAFGVWLKTLPPHVWEAYARYMLKRAEKRDTEADRIDPRDELARHFAKHFDAAGWEVRRVPKGNLFG